jgi:hypothetical protein
LDQVYEEFADRGVPIVNESWGNEDAFEALDYIRDWHARYNKTTFVKAAGNYGGTVFCHSLNALCVGGTNANGTYDDFTDDDMFGNSSWENPLYSNSHPDSSKQGEEKDAERPDVVSEGEDAWVMDRANGKQAWTQRPGTSYSAPTVAGLLALFEEECGPNSPLANRSLVRSGAWRTHDLESPNPAYPIPGFHDDAKAGAGIIHAGGLRIWCGGGGGGGDGSGTDDPSTDQGWDDIPDYATPEKFPEPDESVITKHQSLRDSNGDYVWRPLWSGSGAHRLRATLSFYTCPPSDGNGDTVSNPGSSVDKLEPAIDYDLMLCSDEEDRCLVVSESLDDTNEGFDVEVPNGSEGSEWTLYAVRKSEDRLDMSDYCDGPDNGRERYHWSVVGWW